MRKALHIAEKTRGKTSPNPAVGALIVDESGQLVGEGVHLGPHTDHAEVAAMKQAGARARGGTLYVTLEPCSHHGRTPPCTDAIIAAGIRRVVAATLDPNPLVSGRGFAKLRDAGIEVATPCLQREARLLNKEFMMWAAGEKPYVYLKIAQSIDGKVATHTGESQWITSAASRNDGHHLRAMVDAIIVGIGTVRADDPMLTARPDGEMSPKQPLRVVLDSQARISSSARMLQTGGGRCLVAVANETDELRVKELKNKGIAVWQSPIGGNRVHIPSLLSYLASQHATSVLVEGGPTVAGAFWDLGLVDEVIAYVAPRLIGGAGALPSLLGKGVPSLDQAPLLADFQWKQTGDDVRLTGRIARPFFDEPSDASQRESTRW